MRWVVVVNKNVLVFVVLDVESKVVIAAVDVFIEGRIDVFRISRRNRGDSLKQNKNYYFHTLINTYEWYLLSMKYHYHLKLLMELTLMLKELHQKQLINVTNE